MKKYLLYSFALSIFLASCSKKNDPAPTPEPTPPNPTPTNPYVPDNSFKIVAYMPSYRDPSGIPDGKYKMITHLFYAFLAPSTTADGSLQALEQAGRFGLLKAKAKANNVKFGISIGPAGGATENTYASIASSATARTNFIKNVVAFAVNNQLDGVDMDWEYPRTPSLTDVTPNANFTLLMKELSLELHKVNKFLSAAITPGVYASTNRHAIATEVYQYVDFFNIMQYDGAGYDTNELLNHAPYNMSVNSLNFWLNTKNMPREKAIVGMPIYGKNAAGNSIVYSSIIAASAANANVNVATVNGVAYGYNGVPLIKQKTQLAKDRANGIMFWEFGQDTNDATSLIKAANDQLGRAY
jgi:GH18 family chitinase